MTLMTHQPKNPISRASVAALSEAKREPGWLTDLRLAAWDRYQQVAPSAQLRSAALDQLESVPAAPRKSVPSHEWPKDLSHTLEERGDEEGTIIQRDGRNLSRALTKDAVKRGVIYTDMDSAVRTVPELVRPLLSQPPNPNDGVASLHAALWNGGSFLYVPSYIEIQLPFHTCFWATQTSAAFFPMTMIHVGPGSQVTFMDEYLSKTAAAPNLAVVGHYLEVAEKARLYYLNVQNWGKHTFHLSREITKVSASAELFVMAAGLGAQTEAITLRLERTAGSLRRVETTSAGAIDDDRCAALVERDGLSPQEARYEVAREYFEPVLGQLPDPAMREKLCHYVVGTAAGERPILTLHRTAELHPEVRH